MSDQFEKGFYSGDRGVGAEIGRAVRNQLACEKHPRKVLILNAYPGIGLVILKQDIIPWLVFFYETVLEQKCIGFIIDDCMPEFNGAG